MEYKYEMSALTDEKRANLVNWLIGQRDACDELHGDGCTDERCVTSKIALAALTAEPVGLDNWNINGLLFQSPPVPALKPISLMRPPKVRDTAHETQQAYAEGVAAGLDAAKDAIRAAGYEVKE